MFEQAIKTSDFSDETPDLGTSSDIHRQSFAQAGGVPDVPGDIEDDGSMHLRQDGSSHTTGSQLRRRLITPQSIAELAQSEKPSLLDRVLRRKQSATKP